MKKICSKILEKMDKSQIYLNEPMSKHTSFKIGGPADIFIKTKNINELIFILKLAKEEDIKTTIIGNGSNLLVKDRRYKRNSYKTRF